METAKLKKFAQGARTELLKQVAAKLALVLDQSSAARRENPAAVEELMRQIRGSSIEQVIEKVAYTWFNRFCALRFMDVNGYTRIRVLSSADERQVQPEILAEAKMGHIDEERVSPRVREQIFALLNGGAPSRDPQQEAYRLLLVAECNSFSQAMPYLFERIADYTELLLPDDLLSVKSMPAATREAMTPDVCQDVEVIGWLYQFYISEKKDAVFEGLKKNQKITPENIPAATQLFTPHWIVRFLVENSLGRLWMLNNPDSALGRQMEYYIKPEEPETDFLRIERPEEIKVCDPACGSGHMLTYAFDLLYAVYEEAGADPSEIPEKILTHNLYGIEIDERAGELAAFALTMKARAKQRRFFSKAVKPNICVLGKVEFSANELDEYMVAVGRDLFTLDLRETLKQFEEADNFGSLIRPKMANVQDVLPLLQSKDMGGNLFLADTHRKVWQVLRMAEYLSPHYQVVIANPPYMGSKGMNGRLGAWIKDNYPDNKSDLFSAFMERIIGMVPKGGSLGMMTPFTWMFLSSYEKLRKFIFQDNSITALVRPEYHAFFDSAYVPICGFTLFRRELPELKGAYVDLTNFYGAERQPEKTLEAIKNPGCGWLYRASSNDLRKLPGSPIAYWISQNIRNVFQASTRLGELASPRQGLATGDNGRFVRSWHEISISKIKFDATTNQEAVQSSLKWFPYNKGGDYRKWYGNQQFVVNWENDGSDIRNFYDNEGRLRSRPQNTNCFFRESLSWSKITSGGFSLRYFPSGFVFDVAGCSIFVGEDKLRKSILGVMNSPVMKGAINSLSPTLNFEVGQVADFPLTEQAIHPDDPTVGLIDRLIQLSKIDWDLDETSWGFASLPLLSPSYHQQSFEATYHKLRTHWLAMTKETRLLEETSNRIFIEAYGLQHELKPEVPHKEITLTCNPHYRYGDDKTEAELEALLLADTMREFLSYAVGCMFGRYSLDKPGLVLANQGDTLAEYFRKVPEPRFMPDEDNVIPLLDGEWFPDDVTERFRQFLRVTFGEEHYEANQAFIENALGKDIRKYFVKDFYADHVKRYRKLPIYWLFSSPKGGFNALVYLHRYRPDTASLVLRYLRDFRTKLAARLDYQQQIGVSGSASQGEKTRANKEIDSIRKQLLELDDYERDTLYPLATTQVALDLDEGVKVNYVKLGPALKKIVGLDAKGGD